MARPSKHQKYILDTISDGHAYLYQFKASGECFLQPTTHGWNLGRITEKVRGSTLATLLDGHHIRLKIEGGTMIFFEQVPVQMELVKWECAACGHGNSTFVVNERITCKHCGQYSIRSKRSKEWGFMQTRTEQR